MEFFERFVNIWAETVQKHGGGYILATILLVIIYLLHRHHNANFKRCDDRYMEVRKEIRDHWDKKLEKIYTRLEFLERGRNDNQP